MDKMNFIRNMALRCISMTLALGILLIIGPHNPAIGVAAAIIAACQVFLYDGKQTFRCYIQISKKQQYFVIDKIPQFC